MRDEKAKGLKVEFEERLEPHEMSIEQTLFLLHTKGPTCSAFIRDEKHSFGNFWTWWVHKWLNFFFLLEDKFFIFLVFYISISAVGCFIDPIWYAFAFIDFCIRFQTLKNVFKSITLNGDQLILAGVLIVIVIYIYSVIGFFFFQSMFWEYGINPYDSDVIGES